MQEKYIILEYFKDQPKGRFLEIGANDGVPFNDDEPVWGLLEKGWSGVYCEPNPESCADLIKNIGPNRPDIEVVNCAITVDGGIKTFHAAMGKKRTIGLSSFNKDWITYLPQMLQDRVDFVKPILSNTITFAQLTDSLGCDFDLVTVDVENSIEENDKLIQSIDFSILNRCRMLLVESISHSTINYLASFGYTPYTSSTYTQSDFNYFFVKNNIP